MTEALPFRPVATYVQAVQPGAHWDGAIRRVVAYETVAVREGWGYRLWVHYGLEECGGYLTWWLREDQVRFVGAPS